MLHWAPHDSAFVYMVTNTVHVYSRNDNFASEWARVRVWLCVHVC